MPKRSDIKKVLVIGSGPIIIGQAAEFDYSGTQACRALSEEGVEVVLVNSNPATIMTDVEVAERVYVEPLTPEFVTAVIAQERPDGLLATLGGQTGLNLALALAQGGILDRNGVPLLGTPLSAIQDAEDRERFRTTMMRLGHPVLQSRSAQTVDDALAAAQHSAIRWWCGPGSRWGEREVASSQTRGRWPQSLPRACWPVRSVRSWSSAASRDGKRSSTRSSATARGR